MEPFDMFRERVQDQRRNVRQAQESIAYARTLISKEKDIGPGQCARIVQSIQSVEEPLRNFYELLDTPDSLPPRVRSHRHPLLIILDNAYMLLQDVISNIGSLHQIYRTSSSYEAHTYRQDILNQLESLDQKRSDIEHGIERLLFYSTY